jgi:hypothetical protein
MTWHRIGGTSLGAFVLVLAFLAGRMNAGADPALTGAATTKAKASVQTQQSAPSSTPEETYSTDTYPDDSSSTSDPNPPVTASS